MQHQKKETKTSQTKKKKPANVKLPLDGDPQRKNPVTVDQKFSPYARTRNIHWHKSIRTNIQDLWESNQQTLPRGVLPQNSEKNYIHNKRACCFGAVQGSERKMVHI